MAQVDDRRYVVWGKEIDGDEETFLAEHKGLEPIIRSMTTRGYETPEYRFLFSIDDGHLAWRFNKATQRVEYECGCMKRGRERVSTLSFLPWGAGV